MSRLEFNKSPEPTIGVELELQILDAETYELTSLAPEILDKVSPVFREKIKPEFIQSMVEINTGICSTVADVEKDLKTTYALQLVGRRFISQGLHVHIGVDDEEKVIKINNHLRIYLPILLALTTSSPFFETVDTGLMSYRSKLFEALPLAGMPDSLDDWEEYETLIALLRKSGIIESVKDIWWDVRPHPDFGTVEIRICDLPYTMRDILAITALIQSLVIALADQYENPEPHMQILRSNKWQAARYGLDGFYVDPFFGNKYSFKEAAISLYRHVKPISEDLNSTDYLDEVPEIVNRSTGAHLQKRLHQEEGKSFPDMIRTIQDRFLK